MHRKLDQLLVASADRRPDATAVEDPSCEATISYRGLDEASDSIRHVLVEHGVRPGDRVGICARKSIGSLASIFGVLKAGAAYVPVDVSAPAARNAFVFHDCEVRAILAEERAIAELREAYSSDRGRELADRGPVEATRSPDAPLRLLEAPEDIPAGVEEHGDLSYILYTSGSTGLPKGVAHTHSSALSFVDWCSETFAPTERDVFSSHAPFHFDLSILDIYLSIKHGGHLVLFDDRLGKFPPGLAEAIAGRCISIWYSTPSVLRVLVEYGKLHRFDFSSLRLVLFAGEVFPIKHLRALQEIWRGPRFFNLYGPTETNVCTWLEIPGEIPPDRDEPFPIGHVCSNDRAKVVDEAGAEVAPGAEGELCIAGGTVMLGYWNRRERTELAFLRDAEGTSWYRTGDVVKEGEEGELEFLGRRDRMIKRHGYRIELGEIESALYRHPSIVEAAALALSDEDGGVRVRAILVTSADRPSLLELKAFCAANLPAYMAPDTFDFLDALPKTSTDKVDYQQLQTSVSGGVAD